MKITGTWLTGPVQRIFSLLEEAGHSIYAVGGCVRNDLMDEPVNDVDLATDALPQQVIDICATAGVKTVPTGIDHGTVTIPLSGQAFEITTFRKDVETDGRHAVVAFSSDIATDAKRRDFTINAIYADRHGTIIDPLGGLDDIDARIVRFIDDPQERIREDGLRILRFFRFFAAYGDPAQGIDPDGLGACASNTELLDNLSAERISAELIKLLGTRDPAPALGAMEASGVLARVMPGATAGAIAPLVHAEGTRPAHWVRRLAAMGGTAVTERMRLSKADTKRCEAIRDILEGGLGTKVAAYKYGQDCAIDAGLISASMAGAVGDDSLENLASEGAKLKLPIKAKMLLPVIPSGPGLGRTMRRLEEAWIASDFTLDQSELLNLATEQGS